MTDEQLDALVESLTADRGFTVVFVMLLVILLISLTGLGVGSWLVYKFLTSPCTW